MELHERTQKLSEISVKNHLNPYTAIDWPKELDQDAWHFSEKLISIKGTRIYEFMDENQKKKLSFYEQLNFFSINIHGEKELIEGISRRLHRPDFMGPISEYLHHFLEEENHHMYWFSQYCSRYAHKLYPNLNLPSQSMEDTEIDDFFFFIRVLVFEHLVDYYNKIQGSDKNLEPTARRINQLHHEDETRHIAFGVLFLEEAWKKLKVKMDSQQLLKLYEYVQDFLLATSMQFFNPKVYRDTGLENAMQIRDEALKSQHAMDLIFNSSKKINSFLSKLKF